MPKFNLKHSSTRAKDQELKSPIKKASLSKGLLEKLREKLKSNPPPVEIEGLIEHKQEAALKNWSYSCETERDRLEFAARRGLVSLVERILDSKPELVNNSNVLSTACLCNQFALVQVLIQKYKADVNYRYVSYLDERPIFCALFSGNIQIVELLIKNKVNLDVQSNPLSESPLAYCLSKMKLERSSLKTQYIPILKLLISAGADTSKIDSFHQQTPLELAQKIEADDKLKREIYQILTSNDSNIDSLTNLLKSSKLTDKEDISIDDVLLSLAMMDLKEKETSSYRSKMEI